MKIVVLDGHTLNPGDLSWAPFKKYGSVDVYPSSTLSEGKVRAKGADVIVVNKFVLTKELLHDLKELKLIVVSATGMNNVDLETAAALNIPVKNVAGYSTDAVAQHVFSFLLNIQNRIALHNESVHAGEWSGQEHFSYTKLSLGELAHKTLGLYGFGTIGRRVAEIARAFKMDVLVHSQYPDPSDQNVEFVSLEELFERSDFVSLHTQLTAEKEGIIDLSLFRKMKRTAWLINTARGGLINEIELSKALDHKLLAGAALDVLSAEPPLRNNSLIGRKDVIITPHIAWSSKESRQRLMNMAAGHLEGQVK